MNLQKIVSMPHYACARCSHQACATVVPACDEFHRSDDYETPQWTNLLFPINGRQQRSANDLVLFQMNKYYIVEARGSPRRRPFVFKDEGSVLVFCIPVLFLYMFICSI